ncbi:MAG: hypothetical protein FJX77_09460, partial [Armatimonadetes bacterium]|nr:hypothetical protein [Armatimonadota bacterium]
MMRFPRRFFLAVSTAILLLPGAAGAADWPTLHQNGSRTGFTEDSVRGPYHLDWVREFPQETLPTRVEAIVAGGRVFVGTLSGNLHALDRRTGRTVWTAPLGGPILHSPSVSGGTVYAATAGAQGAVTALDSGTGRARWRFPCRGGFAASPLVVGDRVYLGSRSGEFFGLDAATGRQRSRLLTRGPIRCTAATDGKRVYFASDDMRAYAVDARTGAEVWRSAPLAGQSFRDYYPVILGDRVLFRSVLGEDVNRELNGGTGFLQELAGLPPGWKALESFLKSGESRGTPELEQAEQAAILQRLQDHPTRRTCFLLDAATGRESAALPVMYIAGNQGCGLPPALTRDQRPLLLYRTVYGNWSRGVKPGVGIGYLNTQSGLLEPLRHAQGNEPPWNTFWGTSDESTALSVGGDLLYLTHQGTLAALNL